MRDHHPYNITAARFLPPPACLSAQEKDFPQQCLFEKSSFVVRLLKNKKIEQMNTGIKTLICGILLWLHLAYSAASAPYSAIVVDANTSLIQHALLLAIMSRAFSSLGYAHERAGKARGARSCLYTQKL